MKKLLSILLVLFVITCAFAQGISSLADPDPTIIGADSAKQALKEVSVDMSKQINDGAHFHPYFDKVGTYYIKDVVLTDNGADAPSEDETAELVATKTYYANTCIASLPEVQREGSTFLGWSTSKWGGRKVQAGDEVFTAHTALYAHWEKNQPVTELPVPTETQPVTEGTVPATDGNIEMLLMGDVDFSGKVNIRDATKIQKMLAKFEAFDDKATFVANVVDDNKVNIKDATAIQKYCAFIEVNAEINIEVIYLP